MTCGQTQTLTWRHKVESRVRQLCILFALPNTAGLYSHLQSTSLLLDTQMLTKKIVVKFFQDARVTLKGLQKPPVP